MLHRRPCAPHKGGADLTVVPPIPLSQTTETRAHRAHRAPQSATRALIPLPAGATQLTIDADGTLLYDNGDCAALVQVAFINLDSLSADDQAYTCAGWARLAAALVPQQQLQIVVESNPLPVAEVQEMVASYITTDHPALRTLGAHTIAALGTEMERTPVPAKSGYLLVFPAPDAHMGLAGATQGLKEAIGLRHAGAREPDRHGLDSALEDVLSVCARSGLRARRVRGAAAASLLWRCVNPGLPEPPQLLAAPDLVAALSPCDWQETFTAVRSGAIYTRSFYIMEPPDLTSPGWLDDLVAINATVRITLHVTGRDRDAERARQLKRRRRFYTLATTGKGLSDPDSLDASAEAERLADELLQATVGLVSTGLIVTVQALDLATLRTASGQVRRILRTRLAAPFGYGRGHQAALWRASLPFGVDTAHRTRRWHTISYGNALPFLAHSPGMSRGFPIGLTTRGSELVALNLSDRSLPTWAVTVNGRQGSGKTFITQLFTLHTLFEGGRATIIDRAGHYRMLIDLAEGRYIPLGAAAQPPTINLWDVRPGEEIRKKIEMVHAAHEIMFVKPGQQLDDRLDAALERAIRQVYAQYQMQVAAGERAATDYPLERELVTAVEALARGAGLGEGETLTERERDIYRLLRDKLYPYVGEGRYAHLIDRPTTVDLETRILCFDFQEVDEGLHPLLMYIIGYAMARRAANTYNRQGAYHPELLVIDEGWFIAKYTRAGKWLEDTARRTRHMGLRFVFTTQQLSDLLDYPAAVAVFNAASLKCLFRQHDAQTTNGVSTIDWLGQKLQISPSEAKSLTQLAQGQMMLVREGKDGSYRRGLVEVKADPYTYWLFTSEPDHDVPAKIAAQRAAGGNILTALDTLVTAHGIPQHGGQR